MDFENVQEEQLVPLCFTTSKWRDQYSGSIPMNVPGLLDIQLAAGGDGGLQADDTFAVPVAAPAKRGRPFVSRQRCEVEFAVIRNMHRNTTRRCGGRGREGGRGGDCGGCGGRGRGQGQ